MTASDLQAALAALGFVDADDPPDDSAPDGTPARFLWRMMHPQTLIDVGQYALEYPGCYFVESGQGRTLASAIVEQLHRAHKPFRDDLDDARDALDAAGALDRHLAYFTVMRAVLSLAATMPPPVLSLAVLRPLGWEVPQDTPSMGRKGGLSLTYGLRGSPEHWTAAHISGLEEGWTPQEALLRLAERCGPKMAATDLDSLRDAVRALRGESEP